MILYRFHTVRLKYVNDLYFSQELKQNLKQNDLERKVLVKYCTKIVKKITSLLHRNIKDFLYILILRHKRTRPKHKNKQKKL